MNNEEVLVRYSFDYDFYKIESIEIIEYQLQSKFKVGDKVRVNNTSSNVNGIVGVIESVSSSSPLYYYVKIDDDDIHEIWYIYEIQLEKVEEPIDKEETIDDIIGEIKTKWSEINILLNQLEKMEKEE